MTLPVPLASLQELTRTHLTNAPAWSEVVDETARLRVGAAQADAAVLAGLATDTAIMTTVDHWPADLQDALKHLGLFDRYSPTTLQGVLTHLSSRQITGLTNTAKGTMLELHVQHAMNSGTLPMVPGADHAELAHSLNQPGWDVAEVSRTGEHLAHVQVKATDSWHYIARHLSRYPEYPVVATTHEAAQAAATHGIDHTHLIDTGVSGGELTAHAASHLEHLDLAHASHELVPEFAIAAILFVAGMKLRGGESQAAVAVWVKEQATLAGISNAAGLAAQLLTGTVLFRPFAALGARFTAERGRVARQTGATLRRIRNTLELVAESCRARGYQIGAREPAN